MSKKLKIGLIDADVMWRQQPKDESRRARRKPNREVGVLTAWFKGKGYEVEWFNTMGGHYDRVFIIKAMISTPDYSREVIDADTIAFHGKGFKKKRKDDNMVCSHPKAVLIENFPVVKPDYSLYPEAIRKLV